MTQVTDNVLQHLSRAAQEAGVFGEVDTPNGMLRCAARNSAEPAFYRIEFEDDKTWVALVTSDRWLSESIEADLMHHGDPIEELIEEELVDLGYDGPALAVKHYRSDDMLYTFRSVVPIEDPAAPTSENIMLQCLLAYEAAFRELGDMDVDEEE